MLRCKKEGANNLKTKAMKTEKYTGLFISSEGHKYSLSVYCNGYLKALILLTAKAIEGGSHYQLSRITMEDGDYRRIDDILNISKLILQ